MTVDRRKPQELISIRLPIELLAGLKKIAKQQGRGYQAVIKDWLSARLLREQRKV